MRLGERSVVGVLSAWGIALCVVVAFAGAASAEASRGNRWPSLGERIGVSHIHALKRRAHHQAAKAHTSIAGGDQIAITAAPWQIELFAEISSEKELRCGGELIDSTHILTAAHCTFNPETSTRLAASAFVIVAGIAPMTGAEIATNPAAQVRFVASVRVHPYFQYTLGTKAWDDVAVLTLAEPVTFGPSVQAIGLAPAGAELPEGAAATVTGFGREVAADEPTHELNSLSTAVASKGACGGEANAVWVCTKSRFGSACSGDSGGALTSGSPPLDFGVLDIVAIISGQECQPTATNGFTNVAAPEVRDFIEGSETPPTAPRGGKGVAFRGEGEEGVSVTAGTPLSCEPGSWSGSPTLTFVFGVASSGVVLQSGAASAFTPTSEDVGDGIYCEVRATNGGGTGVGRTKGLGTVDAGPPAEAPVPPALIVTPLRLTHLAESHPRWREGGASARISALHATKRPPVPLGTTFTFSLSEQAKVTFTFTEQLVGYRAKGRCLALPSRSHHVHTCKRTVVRGRLTFTGHPGLNKVAFQGHVSDTEKLPPGSYVLEVGAADSSGQSVTAPPLAFVTTGTG